MNATDWNRLFNALEHGTKSGKAKWSKGDLPNSWVMAGAGGSVVLVGPRSIVGDLTVEVRDELGKADSLPSVMSQIGSGLLRPISEDDPSGPEVSQLQQRASVLLHLVREHNERGAKVADKIIDGLK